MLYVASFWSFPTDRGPDLNTTDSLYFLYTLFIVTFVSSSTVTILFKGDHPIISKEHILHHYMHVCS